MTVDGRKQSLKARDQQRTRRLFYGDKAGFRLPRWSRLVWVVHDSDPVDRNHCAQPLPGTFRADSGDGRRPRIRRLARRPLKLLQRPLREFMNRFACSMNSEEIVKDRFLSMRVSNGSSPNETRVHRLRCWLKAHVKGQPQPLGLIIKRRM